MRLEELKAKGRLVLHGSHRPILIIYDNGRVFALPASTNSLFGASISMLPRGS